MKAWVGGSHACAWLPSSFCGGLITSVTFSGSGHCCCSSLLIAFFLGWDCAHVPEESLKSVWFPGWASAPRSIPLPIPSGHSDWLLFFLIFLHLQSLVLLMLLLLFPRIHYHVHVLSRVGFSCHLMGNAGAQLQVTGGGWEEFSLNCPIGGGVCCLHPSELAVSKLFWSGFPPFPAWLSDRGGRYEFSSLWLITWPVFFQLLLACAALIMGLFLAAAGETLQLTQAPSISPDLPSWFLSASEFSRNPLSCSLRAYCECQCAGH